MYNGGKMNGADKVAVVCYIRVVLQLKRIFATCVQPMFRLTFRWPSSTRLATACFKPTKVQAFRSSVHHFWNLRSQPRPHCLCGRESAHTPDAGDKRGCTAPSKRLWRIDARGHERFMFSCTDHPTLTDELNKGGISWKYYTPSAGSLWTSPNAIEHMCGPDAPPPHATACVGPDWKEHVVIYSPKIQPLSSPTSRAPAPNGELGHAHR